MNELEEWKNRKRYAREEFGVELEDENSSLAQMIKTSFCYKAWTLKMAWKSLIKSIFK